MQELKTWYKNTVLSLGDEPRLVIMLQDFESFHPGLLQDFLAICSEYRPELPLVLLFGIATSTDVLSRMLPRSAMAYLQTEKFYLQQSLDTLNQLVHVLFVQRTTGCHLGYRPYRYLVDNLVLHHFSLASFLRGVKYCFLEHYYDNPWSFLCREEHTTDRREDMETLSGPHCDSLRQLPSFRRYVTLRTF
jgi:origin recognition complex subunit 3